MKFLSWLKSLFKKPAAQPVTSKGWDPYWSEILNRLIYSNLKSFDAASDIKSIRQDWFSLSEEQKTQSMTAFIKALAFYESGYDPLCESVDVGSKFDKQTWSVGLLQLSGVDKANLGLSVGFDYERLKIPENNLTQGIAIFVNQIAKRGKIIIPKSEKGNPGVYFATLNPGNQYDKSKEIIAAAQISFPKEQKPLSELPWLDIAMQELGVSETKNPKRVIEYHQATGLKAKDVKTAWCSSFANWVLREAKIQGTNSAWARDWLEWGLECAPKKGCILVFERNAPGGDSHVGFHAGDETADMILLLSGNVGDEVCLKWYPKRILLGARWPKYI